MNNSLQNLSRTQLVPGVEEYGKSSMFNTPLITYAILSDGNRELKLEAVFVDIELGNDLVITDLYGSTNNRQVIERTRKRPDRITLRGTLMAGKGGQPIGQRIFLSRLVHLPYPISITCPRLLEQNIQDIVVERCDLPQDKSYNLQPFQIIAYAARPVQLEFIEENQEETSLREEIVITRNG